MNNMELNDRIDNTLNGHLRPGDLILQYNDLATDLDHLLDLADKDPSESFLIIHEGLYREILNCAEDCVDFIADVGGTLTVEDVLLEWNVRPWLGPVLT